MSAPLKLHRLRLYFSATATTPGAAPPAAELPELDIVVTPGDRMRAERVSTTVLPPSQRGAQAVRAAHAQTWLMLYAWCAAVRCGYPGDFEAFDRDLLHYAELGADGELLEDDDDPDDDAGEAVPPTVPGPPTS